MDLTVKVKRTKTSSCRLPLYQSSQASGVDLVADIEKSLTLTPMARAMVSTGIAVEIPPGFEGQVRPRSGRAIAEGLTLINSPGTVDSDYRGEIYVLVINLGVSPIQIQPGERIAQLVFAPVARAALVEVQGLAESSRSSGGFGHTGR